MADNDAHKVALELMKQLITLSSGILALSATFIDNFQTRSAPMLAILVASWVCLVASVFFGLETISAIVQSRLAPEVSDWSRGVGRKNAQVSKYTFVAGLVFFGLFAFLVLTTSAP